jgi:hypothetical protein|tara:strand:+ start:98 stop:232 length:135 start_codon:yes stop_codon:yes gene_type:complete
MDSEERKIIIAKLLFVKKNMHLIHKVFTDKNELSMILDYLETIE